MCSDKDAIVEVKAGPAAAALMSSLALGGASLTKLSLLLLLKNPMMGNLLVFGVRRYWVQLVSAEGMLEVNVLGAR